VNKSTGTVERFAAGAPVLIEQPESLGYACPVRWCDRVLKTLAGWKSHVGCSTDPRRLEAVQHLDDLKHGKYKKFWDYHGRVARLRSAGKGI